MSTPSLNLSKGPHLNKGEKGVHIIYVPETAMAAPSRAELSALGDTVTLAKIIELIGEEPAPTDVVVFGGRPYQCVAGALQKHPEVHELYPETVLRLYRSNNERAVWWSKRSFEIVKITRETEQPPRQTGARLNLHPADYPFEGPVVTTEESADGEAIFVARSSVPIEAAVGGEYKIHFTIAGEPRLIDPNVYCGGGR